ncbi:hypothetical protein KKF91_21765 [Myxococcota bacterium]|nr:hypothetical protein [Myxococcota bacterium]MBU1433173.1 hypothetical protein [Myxococcota bacterium]MBU1897348.1 hypothetical protein [Myxococcota bacterium]
MPLMFLRLLVFVGLLVGGYLVIRRGWRVIAKALAGPLTWGALAEEHEDLREAMEIRDKILSFVNGRQHVGALREELHEALAGLVELVRLREDIAARLEQLRAVNLKHAPQSQVAQHDSLMRKLQEREQGNNTQVSRLVDDLRQIHLDLLGTLDGGEQKFAEVARKAQAQMKHLNASVHSELELSAFLK